MFPCVQPRVSTREKIQRPKALVCLFQSKLHAVAPGTTCFSTAVAPAVQRALGAAVDNWSTLPHTSAGSVGFSSAEDPKRVSP